MNGFNLANVSDVYVGGTLARYVYYGSKKIWDAKKTPTYTAPTKVTGLVYNGQAQTLLNAGSTSHGTIYYSTDGSTWSTSLPTSTNASTSIPTYWKLVGDSRHYDVASTQITCSIAVVTPTVVAPTAKTLTYNKSAQTLANAGSTNFGTMKYSLSLNGTYSTSVPTATSGGSYTVWYYVEGNSNINTTSKQSVACSINEKPVTATVTVSPTSYTYSGSACTPTVTAKDGTDTIPSNEYTVTYSNNTNAGTATVTIYDVVGGNYYVEGNTTFTINKKDISPSVSLSGWTYGGTANNPSVSGNSGSGTVSYNYTGTTNGGTSYNSSTKPSAAGSYTVTATIAATTNYNSATCSTTFTIARANISPTVTMSGWTYGSTASTPSVSGNSGSGSVTYTYSSDGTTYSSTKPSNAGSYYVKAVIAQTANYNGATVTNTFTISSKTISIPTPTGYSAQYDGGAHTATFGSCTGASITKYRYSTNNSTWTETTSNPNQTNVGTLYTQAYYTASTNYTGSGWSTTATITVSRSKTASASAVSSLTYNGTTETNGSAQTGVLGSNVSWSGTTSATNAGSYTAYATPTSNYAWSDGTYTQKTISWSIARRGQTAPVLNGASTTYHNTATASVKTAGTVSGGTAAAPGTLTWSNQSRTAVGSQTATAYYAATTTNFSASASSAGVTVQITKATDQSITVTTTARTYNGADQVIASASAHGIANYYLGLGGSSTSAPSSWGSANSSLSTTNAGTYYIWYKGTADSNHSSDISATYYGTVTISKASQSAPTATGATTTYNTTATATASGGGGVGSIEWSNGNTQTTVGSKTTKARWTGNSNYSASSWSNEVTLTMNKADQSAPTATGATVSYGNTATASASGGGGVGSIEWSNGNTLSGNAGSKTTKARWSGNGNYNPSPWSNEVTLCISKINPTITAPTAKTGLVYTGSSQTLYNAGSNTTPGSFSYSNGTRTNAGSQTVSWTFTPTDTTNYNSMSGSFSATIAKAIPSVTAPTARTGLEYNGSAQALVNAGTSSISGTFTYAEVGDSLPTVYDYARTIPSKTNSGMYYVWWKFTPTDTSNYETSGDCVTVYIYKADGTATVTGRDVAYTESSQNLVTVSGNTGTMHYSLATYGNWSTTIPQASAVGTYKVYWYMDESTNYTGIAASSDRYVTAAISKVYASVTAPTAKTGLVYTGSEQDLFEGAVASGPAGTNITSIGTISYAKGFGAGTYASNASINGGICGTWTPSTQSAAATYYTTPIPWPSGVTVTIDKGTISVTNGSSLARNLTAGSSQNLWNSATGSFVNKVRVFSYYSGLTSTGSSVPVGERALYFRPGTYYVSGNGNAGTWAIYSGATMSGMPTSQFSMSGQMGSISGSFTISSYGLYTIKPSNSCGNIRIYPTSLTSDGYKNFAGVPYKASLAGKYGFGYYYIGDENTNGGGSYSSPKGSFVTTIT